MPNSEISGRCMFVWQLGPVLVAEMGVDRMVEKAQKADLSGVWIKVADGAARFANVTGARLDQFKELRRKMKQAEISVWGWQVPYGGTEGKAVSEADLATALAEELDLDGILMDAEGGSGFFVGNSKVANAYAERLAEKLPKERGLAMCGNDIPQNFPDYPFETFVSRAKFNAPQVYYGRSPSVENRLSRAIKANKAWHQPLIPVGAAWVGDGGGCQSQSACAERAREFVRQVHEHNFQGYGFWHWMGAPSAFWQAMFETPA